MKRSRRWHKFRILRRQFWSRRCTQSPNISLQMLLRADYLLSHLRLNCISRPFIIGPVSHPFFYYIDCLIVVSLIFRYTYNLQHSYHLGYVRVFTKLWVKNYRDRESTRSLLLITNNTGFLNDDWCNTISTMRSTQARESYSCNSTGYVDLDLSTEVVLGSLWLTGSEVELPPVADRIEDSSGKNGFGYHFAKPRRGPLVQWSCWTQYPIHQVNQVIDQITTCRISCNPVVLQHPH